MEDFYARFMNGSARFSTRAEMSGAGLFDATGPMVGFYGNKPIYAPGDSPIITFGPSGVGKGTSVIAYNVCGHPDRRGRWHTPRRMVVNDPRGDQAKISWHMLIATGKAGYFINPGYLHGLPNHRVNPWALINKASRTFHGDVKVFMSSFIPMASGEEKFFSARGRELSEAVVKTIAWHAPDNAVDAVTMPAFYEAVLSFEDQGAWDNFAEMMLNTPFPDVRGMAAEMDVKRRDVPKEWGGYISTLKEASSWLSDPDARYTVSASDFSMAVTCEQDCTVYVMVGAEKSASLGGLQRSIFTAGMLEKIRRPEAPLVLFLMDEAAQFGKWELTPLIASYLRGQGIRGWFFFQSPSQVADIYGPHMVSTLIANAGCRQFLPPRDIETATLMSRMCGTQTIEVDEPLNQDAARMQRSQILRNLMAGADPLTSGIGYAQQDRASTHRKKQARLLMTPEENLQMPQDRQLLFMSGAETLYPIYAHKHPYYTRPLMNGAALPNPFHPPKDKVRLAGKWLRKWAPVVTEPVPARLAHWPQYEDSVSYVKGYRPF